MKKKLSLSILLLVFTFSHIKSQSQTEIDSLLKEIISSVKHSRQIKKAEATKQILGFGEKALPILSDFFANQHKTSIQSECLHKYLTIGELAIIIADGIELMPYAYLTGYENCLWTFCEDNPNLVEYYLTVINRDGIQEFQQKYKEWFKSDTRKTWPFRVKSHK